MALRKVITELDVPNGIRVGLMKQLTVHWFTDLGALLDPPIDLLMPLLETIHPGYMSKASAPLRNSLEQAKKAIGKSPPPPPLSLKDFPPTTTSVATVITALA